MSKKGCLAIALSLLFACIGFCPIHADVFSKEREAESLYGKGVHAFFDGDYDQAIRLLKQVDALGTEDPRPYYFLALAHCRLKQDSLADPIFRKAARLEWDGRSARDFNVADALRRIQGNERLYIEMYRKQAKLDWQKAEKRSRQEKYGAQKSNEKDVMASIAQSFVGSAPFGARSADPFRSHTQEDDTRLIPQKEPMPLPVPQKSKDAPKTGQDDQAKPVSDEKKDEPAKEEKKDDADPFKPSEDSKPTNEVKKDDSDPFGSSDDSKSMNNEKKDESAKEEKKDESDPFGDSDKSESTNKEKKDEPAKAETKDDADSSGTSDDSKPMSDEKKDESAEEEKKDESDPFGDSSVKENKENKDNQEEKKDGAEEKKEEKKNDSDDPFA